MRIIITLMKYSNYSAANEYVKSIPNFDEIIENLIFIDNPNISTDIMKNKESKEYISMWMNIFTAIHKAMQLPVENVENGNYLKWAVYNFEKIY